MCEDFRAQVYLFFFQIRLIKNHNTDDVLKSTHTWDFLSLAVARHMFRNTVQISINLNRLSPFGRSYVWMNTKLLIFHHHIKNNSKLEIMLPKDRTIQLKKNIVWHTREYLNKSTITKRLKVSF